ncbi:MAG: alpha/beta hydrolase [Acidobacteria bacterium]|nr:alpha/beta hydrolase [Acidobacteriota bacterium]MCA1639776.1 alpha/beta hydrolase [Acidobacteriota bacterium]
MKNLIRHLAAALTFLIVLSLPIFAQSNSTVEGRWFSTLEFNGIKLRLVLKVSKSSDGFTAKLDSIDQGANDLEINAINQQGKAVRFEAKKYGMSYEGTLNEKGDEISGTFKQRADSYPLIFKRTAEATKVSRPQDPQKPYPYNEEEVFYENKKDAVKLAGTLTFPRDNKPHPAVILITGSGSQDRNETVMGHRPFLVLADYLTRRGIVVLRVDDRGIGGSSAGLLTATSENFAHDVLAGIEYLKSRKEIDPKQIGLVGHSEGGMIAPMVASRSKDVAFIVLMAGLGQTGEDVIYTQTALLQKAGGAPPEITTQTVAALKNIYAILKAEPDNKIAEQKIRESLAKQQGAMNEERRKAFAPVKALLESQIPMSLSAWFRYFIAYDPRPMLEKVKIPVLAINGENDLQAAPKENLALIEAALRKGGNKDFTIKSFPKLNHLFQTSGTGSLDEHDKIEETIAPLVLKTIAHWILKRTEKK